MKTQEYVVGFLFSQCRDYVALIRKNRPDWQAGKYNGIGGKIEDGEPPIDAMIREFKEEAGPSVVGWDEFAVLHGSGFIVHFYRAFGDEVFDCKTMTSEFVGVFDAYELRNTNLIPNLHVMIPLALDTSGIVTPVHFTDSRPQ